MNRVLIWISDSKDEKITILKKFREISEANLDLHYDDLCMMSVRCFDEKIPGHRVAIIASLCFDLTKKFREIELTFQKDCGAG